VRALPSSRPTAALLLVLTSALGPRVAAAQAGPPPTPIRMVTDTFFDTTVTDPYRWLEDLHDSAVVSWLHAQDDYTRRLLDAIPGRAALIERIHALSNAGPSVGGVQFGGSRLFYQKRVPGEDVLKLYVRDSLGAPERLLVDPERLRTPGGPPWALNWYAPSWDGHYVAYGVSAGGSENAILRVLDVTTGRTLPDSIDRTDFGTVQWRPDGRSFFYNRLQRLEPGAPRTQKYRNDRAYLHVLGQPDSLDVAMLGTGISPAVKLGEDDFPFVLTSLGSPWATALVVHGVMSEATIYVAPLAQVRSGAARWRLLVDVADSVTAFDIHGDDVYLLTHNGAPRFKVLRTSLARPDIAHARVVVPESEAVVRNLGAARDALYIQTLDGGLARVWRLQYGSAAPTPVPLPFDGSVGGFVTTPRRSGLVLALASWTHSTLWYRFDPVTGRLTDTHLKEPSKADFSAIAADEVRVPSWDGTMVPLSIVHRRDLARDGNNPTFLDGYGAYGISADPFFDPTLLGWLERGGVFAVCHVRGGGEFGEAWHQAGRRPTKSNTWRDFIACGEYLVKEHWTSPAKLAGTGTSAGGIEIGMAVDTRPDLFRAAVPRVGETNPLRAMLVGEGGPANRPEFGDPTTREGFRDLLAMDAYQHVRQGTAYPAMLITAGMNDPRVDTWTPAKYAARLQAATSSGRPVLLRVEFEGGHGIGSTYSQAEAETADIFAFLFWQLGVPGFQPAAPSP
jgi:prolyl oligopeptidase